MNISALMNDRTAIDAQIDAIPTDLANEPAFKQAFERKWEIEQSILAQKATALDEIGAQLAVLADRARDLGDAVEDDLRRL